MNFNFILQPALMCCNIHLPDAGEEIKLSNAINTQAKQGKLTQCTQRHYVSIMAL